MNQNFPYVLLSPHTIERTLCGPILTRLLASPELNLRGIRRFEFDGKLAGQLAGLLPSGNLADAVRKSFIGDVLLIVFDPASTALLSGICGTFGDRAGYSLRGSFGTSQDPVFVCSCDGGNIEAIRAFLGEIAACQPNLAPEGAEERTLTIIKPENWRNSSCRPGCIFDLFSRAGLRLAGCKFHGMSVAEAFEFYGPVRDALRKKLGGRYAIQARVAVGQTMTLPDAVDLDAAFAAIGEAAADGEFNKIIEFMSGRSMFVSGVERDLPGTARCLILVFDGIDAIAKIRKVLGATDPAKAEPGTVRADFGTSIMVNGGHASDSVQSFLRESQILKLDDNDLDEYLLQQ